MWKKNIEKCCNSKVIANLKSTSFEFLEVKINRFHYFLNDIFSYNNG